MKEQKSTLRCELLSVFCYQLALMLRSGVGSEEAMYLLLSDTQDAALATLLRSAHESLMDGAPLSEALRQTNAFPPYLLRMVAIGEVSGRLDQVLEALANYYRREAETRRALRRAVAYPAVMALLVAVIFLVLVSQVLPVFEKVYTQLGMTLSPTASALLGFGSAGQTVTIVLVVLLVLCALGLLLFVRARGSDALYAAVLGRTAAGKAVDRSRFASVMAMMLSSGLPMDEAVERSVTLLENSALADQFKVCREQLNQGAALADAVSAAGLFSSLQSGLLSAGSRAGVTDQAMEELARRAAEEADLSLDRFLSRFEYGLVVVLCLAIGLVLLSVMLPLLGVLSAIGG